MTAAIRVGVCSAVTGKTLMVQKAAEILDVPFASTDCTSLTQAGYVGDDIEVVLSKLYHNAGGDIDKTQQGVVVVFCKQLYFFSAIHMHYINIHSG